MVSLQALLLTLTVAGTADVTLLDFHSPHCGPCRQMDPTVRRLRESGYAVRKIDVTKQPELARRFGVRSVPCFVMLASGREVDRVEGSTSYDRLQTMFARAGSAAGSPAGRVRFRGQSPDQVAARPTAPGVESAPRAKTASGVEAAARRALHATVRLRVEDADGQSWGTGTIIDVHGDEALVVTCGHIFRESRGKGTITAELFVPGAKGPVPGELISYDSEDRDIGLVSIRLNVSVQPVRVAGHGNRSFRGDRVFSIGCNHGQDPTIRHSHVTAINKYLGSPNVEVHGQPVDGRSGGGLFAADGSLIGICNAADPQDDEGIYAALDTIHWQLAKVGQQQVFADAGSQPPSRSAVAPASFAGTRPDANHRNEGGTRKEVGGSLAKMTELHGGPIASGTEVFCIIRTKDHPQGKLVVIDQPELIQQLLNVSRKNELAEGNRPIIRAQSADNRPPYRSR